MRLELGTYTINITVKEKILDTPCTEAFLISLCSKLLDARDYNREHSYSSCAGECKKWIDAIQNKLKI